MAHIGDLVPKSGIYTNPGVIVEKKEDGTVIVDTEPLSIHAYHRYSNTTGLTVEEKDLFNSILDEIYQNENNVEKLNDIQKEIDRIKRDPQLRNVVQFLRNQQASLIRQERVLPRKYTWDEAQIKT